MRGPLFICPRHAPIYVSSFAAFAWARANHGRSAFDFKLLPIKKPSWRRSSTTDHAPSRESIGPATGLLADFAKIHPSDWNHLRAKVFPPVVWWNEPNFGCSDRYLA
jgi:hypothetical protein